ncbi:MAG: hypothetical protein RL380_740 [Verrucomicrobiota bacterium]
MFLTSRARVGRRRKFYRNPPGGLPVSRRLKPLKIFFGCLCASVAFAQETQTVFLSGHGKDDAVPWKFLCTTGAQSGFWTNLPVPSNWELHGFGTLNYKKDATNPPPEKGLYEKDFVAPASWTNQRVFLVFEGAMTDTSAKLNGQSVGAPHQGGFYRFKYEVTSLVKPGATNQLEVEVAKHSANESVNKAERLADYWVFGGIFRPVHLDAAPSQFIERVAIDARADGAFAMDVFVDGAAAADSVEAQLQTLDSKNVSEPFTTAVSPELKIQNLKLKTTFPAPQLWTAESPHLYQVEVRLKRGTEIVHKLTQRFGFRTFEVRDGDGLYLNGSKIILKGVNRHSFWPDSGRCLSEAVHRLDIATIKDMNANAVRMSHYPPDAQFLDLCDELGLYVLDELGGWHNHYDTEVGTKLVEEMLTRDVNHPSIIFWDNGNEGGWNTNLDKLFAQFDPQQRRVLHPWATFSGLCTAHYLAYDKAEIAASGKSVSFQAPDKEVVATNAAPKYIYLPTEFQHALYEGGGGAGLEDYWRMMMSHSNCAGGFIWALLDEGVRRTDTGQLDVMGNQAPDGIVGPYREREGSFYAVKQIWAATPVARESISPTNEIQLPKANSTASGREVFSITDDEIGVRQKDFLFRISRKTGLLATVQSGGQNYSFTNGPRFLQGSNELAAIDYTGGGYDSAKEIKVTFAGTSNMIVWSCPGNGWLRCDYTYNFTGTNDTIGVVFDYPEPNVKSKRWLGNGPYRVWKNRLVGGTFNVWSNNYNTTITGWRGWEYPEFKGFFSEVRWLQLQTTEGLITVVPQNIPFVQVLTPDLPPGNLVAKTAVKLPSCGLGFLHAIPPIGSKFKAPDQTGPQGQPNLGTGSYTGTIFFHFGELPSAK